MIQPVFSAVMAFLLANWAFNEMPHAAGLLGNPKRPRGLYTLSSLFGQEKPILDGRFDLYHVTLGRNLPSILQKGLTPPRSFEEAFLAGRRKFKLGIYLITDKAFLEEILYDIIDFGLASGRIQEGEEVAALKVLLPTDWRVEVDEETPQEPSQLFPPAVILYRPIPPSAITVYEKVRV